MFLLPLALAAAIAETPATPPSTDVPATIAAYFAGDWNGQGAFASGKPLESRFHFKPILDGKVLELRHDEAPPATFAYAGLISVDAATGKPVMLLAPNRGGGRLMRGTGWQDERLVFESDPVLRAAFALERITFVRLAPCRFEASYEMSKDGATWRLGDKQTFTKQSTDCA